MQQNRGIRPEICGVSFTFAKLTGLLEVACVLPSVDKDRVSFSNPPGSGISSFQSIGVGTHAANLMDQQTITMSVLEPFAGWQFMKLDHYELLTAVQLWHTKNESIKRFSSDISITLVLRHCPRPQGPRDSSILPSSFPMCNVRKKLQA